MASLDAGRSRTSLGQGVSAASGSLSQGSSRLWSYPAQRSQSSFGSRQNRFHADVHNYLGNNKVTPTTVGPGRYNLSGSFVKKSYNITMTASRGV